VFNNGKIDRWDTAPAQAFFDELRRVSENQVIWGGNYFLLPPTRCFVCWDKMQPWPNFSQAEYAWTSFSSPSKMFRFDNRTGDKIHPTQKPVELYAFLLQQFAPAGG
jgi:site-specific DNA-methyltransferase (adenine-specific)